MAEAAVAEKSGKVVIKNIGLLLSGDIDKPLLDANTIVVHDGLITAVGQEKDCDLALADTVIDARGTCLCPGLIDSHVHPVFGDWTPRQNQLGWIESTLHGGVTTMISAGEVHLPGRPKDIVGLKALAITAQRSFDNFRHHDEADPKQNCRNNMGDLNLRIVLLIFCCNQSANDKYGSGKLCNNKCRLNPGLGTFSGTVGHVRNITIGQCSDR